MTNSKRSEIAQEILRYEDDHLGSHFVLLRDLAGVFSGSYRDLDVLCVNFDHIRFEEFLKKNDILVLKRVKRFRFHQYALMKHKSETIILLDIWTELHSRGNSYFSNGFQLRTEFHKAGFHYLPSSDSNAVSKIKCLTQTGKVKQKYIDENVEDIARRDYIIANSIICQQAKPIFFNLKNKFLWLIFLLLYFIQKKQLIIYLLGPDGAGKTTVCEKILSTEIRAKKEYYHGRIPVLPRISSAINKEIKKVRYDDLHKRKFTVWHAIYYSIDGLLSRVLLTCTWYKDRIILCDRTHYDIIAREDYRNVPRIMQKLLIRSLKRPDFCYLLCCEPKQIHERKPELPINEITKQYIAYFKHKSLLRFHTVNTSLNDNTIHEMAVIIDEKNSHCS